MLKSQKTLKIKISLLQKIIAKFQFLLIRVLIPSIINLLLGGLPRRTRTLLIVKNDGIGDYILFRNYIKALRESAKFKSYKIYVLANPGFREIALHLDSQYVDGFYWYQDNYFLSWKLVQLLYQLQFLRLHTILYPVLSRKFTTDWLIGNIKAELKVTVDGNLINISGADKEKSNKYYNKIIRLEDDKAHEFVINRQIIESITSTPCLIKQPFIETEKLKTVSNNAVVIFLGANNPNKKWAAENFVKLCNLLIKELDVNLILASDNTDILISEQIVNQLPKKNVINRVGKTNQIELIELIAGAKLIITGDTAAVHIAAAVNTPAICIAKGDLYGRFIPYPADLHCAVLSLFPVNNNLTKIDYNNWSSLDINLVKSDDVFKAAKNFLSR